jgi:hypothetical protein
MNAKGLLLLILHPFIRNCMISQSSFWCSQMGSAFRGDEFVDGQAVNQLRTWNPLLGTSTWSERG